MSENRKSSSEVTRYVVIAVALLLLLIGLSAFYFFVTRAPSVGEEGEQSRAYMFSIYGFSGDLLRRPSGVGVGPGGDIYVADTGKKR
ncbi:MAG: hypothetical protein C0418_02390, partial [Coriobacteriaceae bacterium]|nr:hypothetical protein [Coriobacteriaceae bacterium]